MRLTEIVQRLRVHFAIDDPLSYVSVLDMGRLWERILNRVGAPIAYTQGYNPHPRFQFAAPLPVGYTSECEIVDLFMGQDVPTEGLLEVLREQSPQGLTINAVDEVPLKAISPQSTMREAIYQVDVWTEASSEQMDRALKGLLDQPTVIVQRERKGRVKDVDLRKLVYELRYETSKDGAHRIHMRLRTGSNGAGRPEEILEAADIAANDLCIHRTELVWDDKR